MWSSDWRSRMSFKVRACTMTSRAVVGSSATRRAGRHTRAIAIIARWRSPPESWNG